MILENSDCTVQSEFGGEKQDRILRHKNTPDGDFDSGEEYDRWCFLKLLQQAGLIRDLVYHKTAYELEPAYIDANGKHIRNITYTPDFWYYDAAYKVEVVEDYKGWERESFKRTAKMFKRKYPDIVFWVNKEIKGMYNGKRS